MNKHKKHFGISTQLYSILFCTLLIASSAQAQTRGANDNHSEAKGTLAVLPRLRLMIVPPDFKPKSVTSAGTNGSSLRSSSLMPMASGVNLQVLGSGTIGRLTKWTGLTSSNSIIGDTTIFESKTGLVGIGTDSPTSRLTVAGIIETTVGGLKFPDGTLQTTSAAGALLSVVHDATLTGSGTSASPLSVNVPLVLSGSVPFNNSAGIIFTAINTAPSGIGVQAVGGRLGLAATGGDSDSDSSSPGTGILAAGGNANSAVNRGGVGLAAAGGTNAVGDGGTGVRTSGGAGNGAAKSGGIGLEAFGGDGDNNASRGLAGKFNGNVQIISLGGSPGDLSVAGTLSKGGGSFKIDHPLDPENRYLYHSFVESPDMKNIYDGNVVTNENGEATVTLPAYFEALNRDFRYQLTVIGTFAQAIVSDEMSGNQFAIRTNAPNVKVSWQVTGIRRDAWANKNRIKVEVEKPENERGYYLHPKAYDQPEERGIDWARDAQSMQKLKETSAKQRGN